MDYQKCKQLCKKIGVKTWVEAGENILEIGDKFINKKPPSRQGEFWNDRLKTYLNNGWLHFCEEKDMECGHCGGIELNNGKWICYNIIGVV